MPNETIETAACDGWKLRVEFVWRDDRFGHLISAVDPANTAHPLLDSVEGLPADDWPPSPPFQSLLFAPQPAGRRTALLVGMAGKSHWSASIGPDDFGESLVFDVACRTRLAEGHVGSRYRQVDRVGRVETPNIIVWSAGEGVVLTGSTDEPTLTELHASEQELEIAPSRENRQQTVTQRWLYRLTLAA